MLANWLLANFGLIYETKSDFFGCDFHYIKFGLMVAEVDIADLT